MAAVNTVDTLTGNFRRRYAKKLERLIPEEYGLQNTVPFNKARKLGDTFHQPAVLQREQGVTYAKTNAGAFNLDAAIAGQIKDAQVQGSQVVIRGALDYESLAKGEGAGGGAEEGGPAFEDANSILLENMSMTIKHRLEIALWYGQSGIGTIGVVAGAVLTIDAKEFAPGIWSGQIGAKIEIWKSDDTVYRGVFTVTAIDINVRNISVTPDPTAAGVVATDRIFFKTERSGVGGGLVENNFAGVHKILTNTGTLFNIDASLFDLWKANEQAVGGVNLSFEAYQDGVALGMGKGLKGNADLWVSNATWAKMMTEQSALRRHGDPNKAANYEQGAEAITFYSQSGRTRIMPNICIKQGFAYLLKPELWQRIGAKDVTFNIPGRGGEIFKHMEDQAGIEVRAYYHQAMFSKAPGKAVIYSGIVNS